MVVVVDRHGGRRGRGGGQQQVPDDLRLLREQPRTPEGVRGSRARARPRAGECVRTWQHGGAPAGMPAAVALLDSFVFLFEFLVGEGCRTRRCGGASTWSTAAAASG